MENSRLAISIPTFNRTEILQENLCEIIPELKIFNIPVYISDNGNNDSTEKMINELKKQYSFFYYHKNPENIGYDLNFTQSLLLPEKDYVWLIGDGMRILPGMIKAIMDIIKDSNYDFIGVNTADKRGGLYAKTYSNALNLFKELYWHLTLAGATIYSRKVISNIHKINLNQYRNFPQNGIIFNIMLDKGKTYHWTALPSLWGNSKKGNSYWKKNVMETFLLDWTEAIKNLPENYNSLKNDILPTHARFSGLFSIYNMLNYRYYGALNIKVSKQFKEVIKCSSGKPIYYFYFFSLIPKILAGPMLFCANGMKICRNAIWKSVG